MRDFLRWFGSNRRPIWIQMSFGALVGASASAAGLAAGALIWAAFPWSILLAVLGLAIAIAISYRASSKGE